MWQRFTERARKVVFYAQEEAQRFGEGYVSAEHLLLGLLRDEGCVGCQVLGRLDKNVNAVVAEVEKQLPLGEARPSRDMTLTPRAKRVIDLAYDEARNLGNNFIGTEHLLLGLIREGEGLVSRAIAKFGLDLEDVRIEVQAIQNGEPAPIGKVRLRPDVLGSDWNAVPCIAFLTGLLLRQEASIAKALGALDLTPYAVLNLAPELARDVGITDISLDDLTREASRLSQGTTLCSAHFLLACVTAELQPFAAVLKSLGASQGRLTKAIASAAG